ncbi:HNH endonuclease [Patescibacteria group bacterium]
MIKIDRPRCPNTRALSKDYKNPKNKSVLVGASFGKCMYCESMISHTYPGDIEHIKPKINFPALEYSWDNLGVACWKCNNKKRDKFDNNTPYINPYEEDPGGHIIALGSMLKQKRGSERGELTILDIDLNRLELVEKRQEKLDVINKLINECFRSSNSTLKNNALDDLKKEAWYDKEYSLCVKYLLKINDII